jgi:spore germination protein YaaH
MRRGALRPVAMAAATMFCVVAQARSAPRRLTPHAPTTDAACPVSVPQLPIDLWGFMAPWDPRSEASARCDTAALSVVISGWLRLDTLTALPISAYPDTLHLPRSLRRFALVTTYAGDRFHRETVERLAGDRALRGRVAGRLARWAVNHGYRGLVLDFEGLTRADTAALATVVQSIADSAHRRHIRPVTVAIVPTDTLVFASRHLAAADLLLLMLYDEHWATGAPGPIASPAWVRQGLALRVAETGAPRLVAGLPTYGYLWKRPRPAAVLSYADARQQAAHLGLALIRDSSSATLHFLRPDSGEAWVADAALTRTLVAEAESLGIRRFALWRLGLEDPDIWGAAFGR